MLPGYHGPYPALIGEVWLKRQETRLTQNNNYISPVTLEYFFFVPEIVICVFYSTSIYQALTMLGTRVAKYPSGGCARQSPWGS